MGDEALISCPKTCHHRQVWWDEDVISGTEGRNCILPSSVGWKPHDVFVYLSRFLSALVCIRTPSPWLYISRCLCWNLPWSLSGVDMSLFRERLSRGAREKGRLFWMSMILVASNCAAHSPPAPHSPKRGSDLRPIEKAVWCTRLHVWAKWLRFGWWMSCTGLLA